MKRPKEKLDRTKGTTVLDDTPMIEDTEQKGDLMIRDLLQNGTESVQDIRIVNIDHKSH